MNVATMRMPAFTLAAIAIGLVAYLVAKLFAIDYLFFAGYTVLQFVVLATAWNILGGYCGYVNFGSAGFFALGAYTSVFFHKFYPVPIPVLIVLGGIVAGLVGLGMGYLTLRLRGVFFAIATLALAIVLQTLIVNWDYVGGSRGAYVIRPQSVPLIGSYVEYLFLIMLGLTVMALCLARAIERSQLGFGFATIRDDEIAAEASGVPTLRLKLIATTLSGALMGMAGAPFPYYIGFLEPASAFGLAYAVNAIAMPMIGGTTSWVGPLMGAILLGTLQQVASVTISSAVNLLIVGLLLVSFVIIAPNGLTGLVQEFLRSTAPDRLTKPALGVLLIAGFGIVAGMFGVVFSLSAITTAHPALGMFELFVSVLLIAAAYGLLKVMNWGRLLALVSYALAAVLSVMIILVNPSNLNTFMYGGVVVISIAAFVVLQAAAVKTLYRDPSEQRAIP